uniref:Protein kinase domain-containing protein n=1 Tax=Aegilops tauschii subsp. strangulata TaxID=200361 RepID=A0A453Q946_AEGTS
MGDEAVLESILNGEMGPTHMPFALLERITENFSEERKIGQGGFALVYKGIYNGEDIAVKKFYDVQTLDNKHFENECDKLIKIKHPNIVRLVGYCYETQHKYVEYKGVLQFAHHICRILCFEYLQGGSLENHLNESRDHDWPTCYNIIEGTCEALNFLHKGYGSRVLHLDLKPGNILLDKYMGAKVADFGLSTSFNKTRITNTTTGTEYYMAPEFKSKRVISPKNDVYSLGIIIIEIMAGRIGYKIFSAMDDDPQELFIEQVITNWRGRINATTSPFPSAELDQVETCIKIAIKCVDLNRKNRPTVAEILAAMQKTEKRFLAEWRNHAEFHVDESLPIPTKSESRGGSGGEVVDIKEHPWRLHSLTISYQGLIDAFSFSYIDQYGEKQHVGPWGEQHSYHKTETIRFSPSEFVEEVSGAYGSHFENLLVTSLTFVTNVRTYGPFGNPNHQNVAAAPLKFMADEGSSIVAFHGRSGSHLFSIGVYMYPNNKRKGRTLLAPVIPDGEKQDTRETVPMCTP